MSQAAAKHPDPTLGYSCGDEPSAARRGAARRGRYRQGLHALAGEISNTELAGPLHSEWGPLRVILAI